jgi:aarF domain-containing kinase
VPLIYLKPTKRVLIMEYIDGIHIDQVDEMKRMGINTKEIGKLFSNMIIKMIHKEGFVHADTHSGNLKVRKLKNNQDQLVILDHGLYQELDPKLVRTYNEFWLGLIMNDPEQYEPAAKALGTSNPKLLLLMLTSKTNEEFHDETRKIFDLNPSHDKQKIMKEASENHEKIIKVLNELKR